MEPDAPPPPPATPPSLPSAAPATPASLSPSPRFHGKPLSPAAPPFVPTSCGRSKAMRWEELAGSDCSDGEHEDLALGPHYLDAARRAISPKP